MATIKNIADLQLALIAEITSKTADDSIDTPDLSTFIADVLASYWNQKDGIRVGSGFDAPLSIPATFGASVHNGDKLRDIVQALMDQANLDHISITGGVQGLQGEFLANITGETNQTLLVNETTSPKNTWRKLATVKLPNDKDGGCFDNGNNWLLDKQVIPSGYGSGKTNVNYQASGFIINLLAESLGTSSSERDFKFVIAKNGTQIGSIESNEIDFVQGSVTTGKYYFNDFETGNIAISTLSANDVITLDIYERCSVTTFIADTVQIQIINGFFNAVLS